MPPKPRAPLKAELKAITDLLEQPADDIEDLARDIFTALEQARAGRRTYIVVMFDGQLVSTWGPYRTIKEAQKAVGDPIIASRPNARGILTILHYDLQDHETEAPP